MCGRSQDLCTAYVLHEIMVGGPSAEVESVVTAQSPDPEVHGGRSGKSGATGVRGGLRAAMGWGCSGGTCQERPKPEPRSPSVFRSQEAEEAERPVGKTRQSGAPTENGIGFLKGGR